MLDLIEENEEILEKIKKKPAELQLLSILLKNQ